MTYFRIDYYVIEITPDGWPLLHGPYLSGAEQKERARDLHKRGKRTLWLDVSDGQRPQTGRVMLVDGGKEPCS